MAKGEKPQQQQQENEESKKREELVNFLRNLTAGEPTYGITEMLATTFEMIDKDPEYIKFVFLRRVIPHALHLIPESAKVTKVSVISTEKTKSHVNTPRLSVNITTASADIMVSYVDINTKKQGSVCLRLKDNPDSDSDDDTVIISIIPCEEVRRKEKNIESGIIDEEKLEEEEEVL